MPDGSLIVMVSAPPSVANVRMDLNDVEHIAFKALGGPDTIHVHDMSGTDVTEVAIDLASSGGGGDGQADTIIVDGTAGDDVVIVVSNAGTLSVIGLGARIDITGFEAGLDTLVINGLGGEDVIDASGLAAGTIRFTADGGAGNDILLGSPGDDTLLGGLGDDVLIGNGGLAVLDGGPGDNIILGSSTLPVPQQFELVL